MSQPQGEPFAKYREQRTAYFTRTPPRRARSDVGSSAEPSRCSWKMASGMLRRADCASWRTTLSWSKGTYGAVPCCNGC